MTKACPQCGRVYVPDLASESDFSTKFQLWRSGVLIQNVWPSATPAEREQLQTGICSDDCWDQYLGMEGRTA